MYEGYLQHDAQEVLQCILGNVQEACQGLKKEMKSLLVHEPAAPQAESKEPSTPDPAEETEGPTGENGKRKSDNEVGNAKKKTKLTKEPAPVEQRLTRSKRKPVLEKQDDKGDRSKVSADAAPTNHTQHKKSKLGLNWLKSSKQPSILSKFRSLGKTDNSSKSSPAEPQNPDIKPDPDQSKTEQPVQEDCKPDKDQDTKNSQNGG